MTDKKFILPVERIEDSILLIRGHKVMLDADLAVLYGVSTKALNQAVKRNKDRFPQDFMFQLTKAEKEEVVTNCDHLKALKFSSSLPYAFNEHGAIMLATVLNSSVAVQTSIQIVKAFVRLRQIIASNAELMKKMTELEKKYDEQFKIVFQAIYEMMKQPEPSRRQIGFKVGDKK